MIDLHSHLLPGIDDGAKDLEQALAMCRMAAKEGCTVIVATPHLRHERYWNDDRRKLERLWNELRAAGPALEVRLGGEIAVSSESLEEIDLLPGGQLLSLAGTRSLLLELDFRGLGPEPVEMVYELMVAGWRPIIAHPERVAWLAEDLELMETMVENGAVMQLTAMSLTGDLGSQIQDRSHRMLDAGLVHLVSSDAHDDRLRPPGMRAAHEHARRRYGDAAAHDLFLNNPRAILEDRPLPPPPRLQQRSGGLSARLRRLAGR